MHGKTHLPGWPFVGGALGELALFAVTLAAIGALELAAALLAAG